MPCKIASVSNVGVQITVLLPRNLESTEPLRSLPSPPLPSQLLAQKPMNVVGPYRLLYVRSMYTLGSLPRLDRIGPDRLSQVPEVLRNRAGEPVVQQV
jgi:hypothetical protein